MLSGILSIHHSHAKLLILFTIISILFFMRVRIYTVMSGSMEPKIPTGSVVFVDTRNRNPRVGDVLTFRQGSVTVTHRLVRIQKETYFTKGDANPTEDFSPVSQGQIIGRVFLCIPLIGYPLLAVRTFHGICLLFLCFLFSLFFYRSFPKIHSNTHNNSEKRD